MTPGILMVIGGILVFLALCALGFNFWSCWKSTTIAGKNLIIHIVSCVVCGIGMVTLLTGIAWFLVLQAKA